LIQFLFIVELTKGGVKYEIIIEQPKCSSPPRVASPAVFSANKSTPEISAEALQKKILAANERRQVRSKNQSNPLDLV